jgi:excisionase family DNA binding protein
MTLTLSEAAEAKCISRNAVWKAVKRGELTARKTSGGLWLIEEDAAWDCYQPRKYLDIRPAKTERREKGDA